MRVSKPKVRAIVTSAVDEIKAAGVEPTVEDILWLAHLADQMAHPSPLDSVEVLCAPVKCGRAKLYPRTIAGDLWLEHCASRWWPAHKCPLMYLLSELYALAHGGNPGVMQSVYSRSVASVKVRVWAAANLPVSYRQIEVALDAVAGRLQYADLSDDTVKVKELSPIDWGEEITLLCSAYKMHPRVFLYELSANQVYGMLRKAALAIGRPELMDKQRDGDNAFGMFRLAVKEIIKQGSSNV